MQSKSERSKSTVYSLKSKVSPNAFTLIELLAVITIISILAGIVLGMAGYANRRAANRRAKAEIKFIEGALDTYKLDYGKYPPGDGSAGSSSNVLSAVSSIMSFTPNQLSGGTIVDPYGTPYRYQTNALGFKLWSFGPDGLTATTDDISNQE